MSKTKKEKKPSYKKQVAADLAARMQTQLADLKEVIGEKKFGNRLRKAVKVLTAGIKKAKPKNAVQKAAKKLQPATT